LDEARRFYKEKSPYKELETITIHSLYESACKSMKERIKEYQEIAEKGIKMIQQDYYFSHQLVNLLKQITEDKGE
jgi:hypothetical protein